MGLWACVLVPFLSYVVERDIEKALVTFVFTILLGFPAWYWLSYNESKEKEAGDKIDKKRDKAP